MTKFGSRERRKPSIDARRAARAGQIQDERPLRTKYEGRRGGTTRGCIWIVAKARNYRDSGAATMAANRLGRELGSRVARFDSRV